MTETADRRSTRWEAHRQERRAAFVDAAVRAIDKHGPEAGIAEIAAEAGVSKPVLYRYFADKDEVYAAVGRWGAAQVLERVTPPLFDEGPVRDRITIACDGYLSVIEEHPAVFALLVRHRSGEDPLADGKIQIAEALAQVVARTLNIVGADADAAEPWAHGLVGLALAMGEWWLGREALPRAEVNRYLATFVWHSLEGFARENGVTLTNLE